MQISQVDVELCAAHADSARDTAIAVLESYVSKKDIPCSERFVVFSETPGWLKQVIQRDNLPESIQGILPIGIPIDLDHIGPILDSIPTDELLTELCEFIMDNMIGMIIE